MKWLLLLFLEAGRFFVFVCSDHIYMLYFSSKKSEYWENKKNIGYGFGGRNLALGRSKDEFVSSKQNANNDASENANNGNDDGKL